MVHTSYGSGGEAVLLLFLAFVVTGAFGGTAGNWFDGKRILRGLTQSDLEIGLAALAHVLGYEKGLKGLYGSGGSVGCGRPDEMA